MKNLFKSIDAKSGKLIAKNLIVLTVLIAVCALSIWSWFTFGQTSYANGINIRSRADGVKVSWDDKLYYDNLQARDESEIRKDILGPAKNICDSSGNPYSLNLITGNGLKFFEPYLNRRTGQTLLNLDSSWQGINVNENNSEGRFVDVDLYFKGNTPRDIYLAGDSAVSPKNPTGNYSDYGAFSKDNIAAASRIAFLNKDKDECSFIWAPNADCELKENKAGYTRVTTTTTEDVTISGGGTIKVDGGVENNNRTYYLWTLWDDSVVDTYPQDLSKFEARVFEYDETIKYFVTEVTMYLPTYDGVNPSIPVFVNESSVKPNASAVYQYNNYIDGAASKNTCRQDLGQYFTVTNTQYYVGNAAFSNAMMINNAKIKIGSLFKVKLGYDPYNKLLVVLSYDSSDGNKFNLDGHSTDITTTVTYYPLDGNLTCTLVNPEDSIAISTETLFKKSVQFKDSSKNNVLPISVTTGEQFHIEKTGDGYDAIYKFKNLRNNKYLTVSNGKLSLTPSGSQFTLYYSSEFLGPILKSGDYYLVIQNGVPTAVQFGYLNPNEAITVYTGSSYEFNTNLTLDTQVYQYYDYERKLLVSLNSTSTPKLFTTTASTAANEKVGDTKIATLTKESAEDEYFTAHVVMRIWVEGTDREAKTPLADGIFDISLHFTSQ